MPDLSERQLLQRHPDNPILTSDAFPMSVNTVFNAAATKLPSGETLLLCRVESRSGRSHLWIARSDDGVTNWRVDPTPAIEAGHPDRPEEEWCVEDARIVFAPECDKYVITYTSFDRTGPAVSIATTSDFQDYEFLGRALPPENKDAAILPRKFDGQWAMIHRPVPRQGNPNIWISFSPDLVHWGQHQPILFARTGPWWDANKIGLSPPLIETTDGWLMMYHGVKKTVAGEMYRLGLALLDLDDPRKCLLRSKQWIMSPEAPYERTGDVSDVVFPCGYTLDDDGDGLNLYYGAADDTMALARGSVKELLAWLHENSLPGDHV